MSLTTGFPLPGPPHAVLCMLVIFGVLGVAFIINRTEGDETTEIAKTAAKVMKARRAAKPSKLGCGSYISTDLSGCSELCRRRTMSHGARQRGRRR